MHAINTTNTVTSINGINSGTFSGSTWSEVNFFIPTYTNLSTMPYYYNTNQNISTGKLITANVPTQSGNKISTNGVQIGSVFTCGTNNYFTTLLSAPSTIPLVPFVFLSDGTLILKSNQDLNGNPITISSYNYLSSSTDLFYNSTALNSNGSTIGKFVNGTYYTSLFTPKLGWNYLPTALGKKITTQVSTQTSADSSTIGIIKGNYVYGTNGLTARLLGSTVSYNGDSSQTIGVGTVSGSTLTLGDGTVISLSNTGSNFYTTDLWNGTVMRSGATVGQLKDSNFTPSNYTTLTFYKTNLGNYISSSKFNASGTRMDSVITAAISGANAIGYMDSNNNVYNWSDVLIGIIVSWKYYPLPQTTFFNLPLTAISLTVTNQTVQSYQNTNVQQYTDTFSVFSSPKTVTTVTENLFYGFGTGYLAYLTLTGQTAAYYFNSTYNNANAINYSNASGANITQLVQLTLSQTANRGFNQSSSINNYLSYTASNGVSFVFTDVNGSSVAAFPNLLNGSIIGTISTDTYSFNQKIPLISTYWNGKNYVILKSVDKLAVTSSPISVYAINQNNNSVDYYGATSKAQVSALEINTGIPSLYFDTQKNIFYDFNNRPIFWSTGTGNLTLYSNGTIYPITSWTDGNNVISKANSGIINQVSFTQGTSSTVTNSINVTGTNLTTVCLDSTGTSLQCSFVQGSMGVVALMNSNISSYITNNYITNNTIKINNQSYKFDCFALLKSNGQVTDLNNNLLGQVNLNSSTNTFDSASYIRLNNNLQTTAVLNGNLVTVNYTDLGNNIICCSPTNVLLLTSNTINKTVLGFDGTNLILNGNNIGIYGNGTGTIYAKFNVQSFNENTNTINVLSSNNYLNLPYSSANYYYLASGDFNNGVVFDNFGNNVGQITNTVLTINKVSPSNSNYYLKNNTVYNLYNNNFVGYLNSSKFCALTPVTIQYYVTSQGVITVGQFDSNGKLLANVIKNNLGYEEVLGWTDNSGNIYDSNGTLIGSISNNLVTLF